MAESASIIIAAISAAGAVGSGIVNAKAAREQAAAQQAAAEYNARLAAAEALAEEQRLRRRNAQLLSEQRTALAKLGIQVEGTPLERLADSATEYEEEIHGVRAYGRAAATLERMGGRAALRMGKQAAAGALIGSVGQAVGAFSGVKLAGGGEALGAGVQATNRDVRRIA